MELRQLLRAVRRFWPVAFVVFALVVALGAAAALLPTPQYESRATVLVSPATKQPDISAINLVQFLMPSISEEIGTRTFRERAKLATGSEPWNGVALSSNVVAGTSVLKISALGAHPRDNATVANAAADEVTSNPISKLVELQVLDRARASSTPVSPKKNLILFAAVVMGIIAALLAAIGAESVLPRVRSSQEIRERFGLEVIGELPMVRSFPRNAPRLFETPNGHVGLVEAYRRLHTNLDLVSAGHRAVGVASAASGEGKSAVTANLAWAMASMGKKVVVVDTDLRRPTLHEYFGLSQDRGVSDIAIGSDIRRVVHPTQLPTLVVIPAGVPTQHPAAILSMALPKILASFKDAFILLDMPPILGTADATLVATMTKAVILVIDAKRGDPTELDQVLHELGRADAEILGVVMNRATIRRSRRTEQYYYAEEADRRS
jgi:tyrosine-protein kinase